MSVVAKAAPIPPPPPVALPASQPEHFQRSDFIAAGLVFLITFSVYLLTLAPNVTLQDSGELITGAVTFGVPHPPGYPLWTMSGWLISHLLPVGNLAWRLNVQSALFGAAANAIFCLLACHSGRWLLQRWVDREQDRPLLRHAVFYVAMMSSLTLGFSDVMWSQSVIAEVYSLNGLFVSLVLLLFYFWMLKPEDLDRLLISVLVFALGLTNHHTLIQIIPAFVVAALLLAATRKMALFWSFLIAINLFSLSILVYLSWLSTDTQLQQISERMAWFIFCGTGLVSIFYLDQFRPWRFALGIFLALGFFAYGHYLLGPVDGPIPRYPVSNQVPIFLWGSFIHGKNIPEAAWWLQISTRHGVELLLLAAASLGLLFSSCLNYRMILGVFAAGWIGLMPYAYESTASSTTPPMNWGYASTRGGFYYAVSRLQYPMSLPNLIKTTIGKAIQVVPHDQNNDIGLDRPNYLHREILNIYYYGTNLVDNLTAPLVCLTLALFLYLRRIDLPQQIWLVFLGVAFFFLGFMLHLIEPPPSFDQESILNYKVFHLQSQIIFVLILSYGALAAVVFIQEMWPEVSRDYGALGLGAPTLFLALLPLWSNFDDCNQADHWFGYNFGADIMRNMDHEAVYYGGTDPGRFVPTYMAFGESQQSARWKREPDFDRRDVAVITQNALCDGYYCNYIRDQYDPRYRKSPSQWTPFEKWLGRDKQYPVDPVACVDDKELSAAWAEFYKRHEDRPARHLPLFIAGSNDVFEVNGIVAQKIFEKNKAHHTFYIEQSVALDWTYPYLIPEGLIFKLNPEPMAALPAGSVEKDRQFWQAYCLKLVSDPKFLVDDDARHTFAQLAYWHADLYRYRQMREDQAYWLKLSLLLDPTFETAASALADLNAELGKYDDALKVLKQAEEADPRNENLIGLRMAMEDSRNIHHREEEARELLAQNPYEIKLNLDLASILAQEGRSEELKDRLRFAAGLTNWTVPAIGDVMQYYEETLKRPDAAAAFLEARAKIDPLKGQINYALAVAQSEAGDKHAALASLQDAVALGGTNALISASIDPRFNLLQSDPTFQALVKKAKASTTNAPGAVPSPLFKP